MDDVSLGAVFDAGGSFHTASVRSPGILIRPSDGVLGEPGDDTAMPVEASAGDVTHAVTIPAGSIAVQVTRGPDSHFVVRLPRGTLLNIQPVQARVNMTRIESGQEAENTTTSRTGISNLTLLDPVRRAVDALTSPATTLDDAGGVRIALVGAFPGALGVRVFPYIIKINLESMEAEFAVVQAFVLPAGTPGVVDDKRAVALVRGEPLVMTRLSVESARPAIDELLREPVRHAPPEIRAMWEKSMPPVIDDYGKILEHIGPIHSVWSARGVQAAWARLDEAARNGGGWDERR